MKKRVIFAVLMMSAAVWGFSQDLRTYEGIYEAASGYATQLNTLREMVKAKVPEASEFYARVLRRLVGEYSNIKNKNDKAAADEQIILLATQLGAEKFAPAAPDLWMVVDQVEATAAKTEALLALGNIASPTYLPHIIRTLDNLNMENTNSSNRKNRITAESLALASIKALEEYKDPSTYIPVFLASIGWYSNEVKAQAARVLPNIAADPAPFMEEVIKDVGYNYSAKLAALRTVEAARLDNAIKAGIAVEALNQGWLGAAIDVRTKTTFATDMRKLAIRMIYKYKTDDEAVYPLLERSYLHGDLTEKLDTVEALASLGTEDAARVLSGFLNELNTKMARGSVRREDEQMVRAVIPALGKTGQAEAKMALNAVRASNWTNAVVNLANDAIKQIDS